MRFRTNIENPVIFQHVVQIFDRMHKKCIVRFTTDEMNLICTNDLSDGSVQVWSQINVSSVFTDYRIQSNANNNITLTLSTEALLAALKSAASYFSTSATAGADIVMKLAKKNDQAVLSFEIFGASRTGKQVKITHDVCIEIMRPNDVEKLVEPMCPEPEVQIIMPDLIKLKTVVERLRAHSDIIGVYANNSGRLQISSATESVSVKVEWNKLKNPVLSNATQTQDPSRSGSQTLPNSGSQPASQQSSQQSKRDPTQNYGVLVSIKSFLKFINTHLTSTTTIACICQNHALILYVYIGEPGTHGGVLTFYVPAIMDE
ncbi:cell cycle checkpoint [Panus rudis PR-1116 ss-1]|nr:cell cycle checkpoint [Panus rudis PR-1116 ss-1]